MKPLKIAFPKHAPMVNKIPASLADINHKKVVLYALAQSTKSGKSYWIHQQSKRIWMLLMDLGHHGNAETPNSIFMSEIIKTCKKLKEIRDKKIEELSEKQSKEALDYHVHFKEDCIGVFKYAVCALACHLLLYRECLEKTRQTNDTNKNKNKNDDNKDSEQDDRFNYCLNSRNTDHLSMKRYI